MPDRNKVVISGTLGSTDAAQWSIGLHFGAALLGGAVVEGNADLTAWATEIAAGITIGGIVGSRMQQNLTAEGIVRDVTCYYYPDGSQNALNVGQAGATLAGTGTVRMPAQSSVVASLRTGISGRSFRGRFYWPAVGETMQDTLAFTAGAAVALAPEFRDFIASIAAAADPIELVPVVYSATRDLVTPVTSIAVGNIPDTQRRRRDNLVESYTVAAYPA